MESLHHYPVVIRQLEWEVPSEANEQMEMSQEANDKLSVSCWVKVC